MVDYVPFIIFLMILAILFEAESTLTVLYWVLGTFTLAVLWNKQSIKHIQIDRQHETRAYLNDDIDISLTIQNKSILPILWVEINESLPANLRIGKTVRSVLTLGSKAEKKITYTLKARKRGLYFLGPLQAQTGDPIGLTKPTNREFTKSSLTVYPQIVDLTTLGLPSRSPFGDIKHSNPIFEDPSRSAGKRDYQHGDSLRQIDWKSTASVGKLQVKLYEASIALDVVIMLDLHRDSYNIKTYFDATELSITAAASIAAWGKNSQQPVGLTTNGTDPFFDNRMPPVIPPNKGILNFINILEILARIQPGEILTQEELLNEHLSSLSWGATLVLISGSFNKKQLEKLYHSKKRGVNPVILSTAPIERGADLMSLADYYAIPIYPTRSPKDLKIMEEIQR